MPDETTNSQHFPLVVIFGRTNVGKSSLFNCLTEKHQALVSDIAGTTRDSNLGQIEWRGYEFTLVDTGGLLETGPFKKTPAGSGGEIDQQVRRQALNYLKHADLILFLVDNKSGLLPQDKDLARLIKKTVHAEKILLTVNKVDSPKDRLKISEFYRLSLGEPAPVSAANGSGTGDLLDIVVEKLKINKFPLPTEKPEFDIRNSTFDIPLRVCIIGKPNVGKSSLLNSLLGYERVIVSPEPHTTREPQHTEIIYQDQPLLLVDTAGISKRGEKTLGLEKFGVAKSLAALKKSDLALLVLDISQPITRQDARLAEEIVSAKKSLIIVANKWDLAPKQDRREFTDYIYNELPFTRYAPIQFIAAKTGEKVNKILDLILKINQERMIKISDDDLAKFLKRIVKTHRPSKGKGYKNPRVREFTQSHTNPPKFLLKIGPKEDLHFSYIRFIENRLRETYGFLGTPITIVIAKKRTAPRRR